MMDDWDLPDSVFLTGGRIRDKGAESTSPAVVCVVVSELLKLQSRKCTILAF